MGYRSKKLIFVLVLVGLLTSGCFLSHENDSDTPEDTEVDTLPHELETDTDDGNHDVGSEQVEDFNATERSEGTETVGTVSESSDSSTVDTETNSDTVLDSNSDATSDTTDTAIDIVINDTESDSDDTMDFFDGDIDESDCEFEMNFIQAIELVPNTYPFTHSSHGSVPLGTADPATLCKADSSVGTVKASHDAVSVNIEPHSTDEWARQVTVTYIPELAKRLSGAFTISIDDVGPDPDAEFGVDNIQTAEGTLVFDLIMPLNADQHYIEESIWEPEAMRFNLTLQVDLDCADMGVGEPVRMETVIPMAMGYRDGEFVLISPGESAALCIGILSEIVAAPLPSKGSGVLGGTLAAHIRPIATGSKQTILMVESGDATSPCYEWRVNQGTLSNISSNIVVYSMPKEKGTYLIQVAVRDGVNAAVAAHSVKVG